MSVICFNSFIFIECSLCGAFLLKNKESHSNQARERIHLYSEQDAKNGNIHILVQKDNIVSFILFDLIQI